MKLIQYATSIVILVLSATAVQAQSQIQSPSDYKNIQASINAVSKKLFDYTQQYPSYSFSAQYDEAGKLTGMDVRGVSNDIDKKDIELNLMELETLGTIVRTMNVKYLPSSKENVNKTMLSENEAKTYKPTFNKVSEPITAAR
jgi:hypothetical protein